MFYQRRACEKNTILIPSRQGRQAGAHATHLAISSREDAPLLEGVFFGDEALAAFEDEALVIFGDKAPFRPRPASPAAAATEAARFLGVDLGDRGDEGTLLLFPRVAMGESGVVGTGFAAFSTAAAPFARPVARLASTPPDLGDGVGLVDGPRFTGVFLGDAGDFLGLAEEERLAGSLEASILEGDCADPPPPLPRPALPLPALGETSEDRPRRGEAGERLEVPSGEVVAPPGELSLAFEAFASRVCLMLLNCRRISAV